MDLIPWNVRPQSTKDTGESSPSNYSNYKLLWSTLRFAIVSQVPLLQTFPLCMPKSIFRVRNALADFCIIFTFEQSAVFNDQVMQNCVFWANIILDFSTLLRLLGMFKRCFLRLFFLLPSALSGGSWQESNVALWLWWQPVCILLLRAKTKTNRQFLQCFWNHVFHASEGSMIWKLFFLVQISFRGP